MSSKSKSWGDPAKPVSFNRFNRPLSHPDPSIAGRHRFQQILRGVAQAESRTIMNAVNSLREDSYKCLKLHEN